MVTSGVTSHVCRACSCFQPWCWVPSSLPPVRAASHSCCVEAIQLIQMKTTFFLVECVVFLLGEFSSTKHVVAAQCGELAAAWLWCGCNVKLLSVGGVPWQGSQTLIRVTAASQLFCAWLCAPWQLPCAWRTLLHRTPPGEKKQNFLCRVSF